MKKTLFILTLSIAISINCFSQGITFAGGGLKTSIYGNLGGEILFKFGKKKPKLFATTIYIPFNAGTKSYTSPKVSYEVKEWAFSLEMKSFFKETIKKNFNFYWNVGYAYQMENLIDNYGSNNLNGGIHFINLGAGTLFMFGNKLGAYIDIGGNLPLGDTSGLKQLFDKVGGVYTSPSPIALSLGISYLIINK